MRKKSQIKWNIIFMFLGLFFCTGFEKDDSSKYKDITFKTDVDRRIFLCKYGRKALESKDEASRKKYLILYFRAFPRDFETFFKILHPGVVGDRWYKSYHSSLLGYNPWGTFYPKQEIVSKAEIPREKNLSKESIEYLKKIKADDVYESCYAGIEYIWDTRPDPGNTYKILDEVKKVILPYIYHEKMISLGVGGFFGIADDYRFLHEHIQSLVCGNVSLIADVLKKKSDEEIKAFFYFFFDDDIVCPHCQGQPKYTNDESFAFLYDQFRTYVARTKSGDNVCEGFKKAYEYIRDPKNCQSH